MGEVFDHMLKRCAKVIFTYDFILGTVLFSVIYLLSVLGCPIEDKRDGGMPISFFMNALMFWIKTEQSM